MASNSIKFNIDFNANTSGINQAKKALEQLKNLTAKDIAIFNNTGMDDAGLKKARELLLEITQESGKAQKAMEAAFNQKLNTVNVQKFKEELIKSGTSLENLRKTLGQAGPMGEKAFTEMSAGLANVKYQTVQTTTFLDKMSASLQRTLTTFISMNIINKVKGSINEAYGYVKNLDTSLNEIRIVTGKSADEMDKFAEKANKAAASLGKATTDYTKASTIFYQQGLSDTEVGARTDVTIKASNTTGQDTKAMADNLTALWNGFNVGAEEAEIYVDRLAALAATTASNLDELTTAMSKTASMANVMGVSEEQLAAQISTVVSVTRQAPESVGTAFKTIYSRISDISAGAEDAETTLGNYSSKLAAMGINVLDSAGNLRDMGDVIEEVGGKWTNYSREQQVAIAGIMGGQRQVNQITALFDNWDEYTKSIETMADAEGTLQKQQDTYMESAEGQLQKLRTEWEGVLDSLLSSDDIIKVAKTIQPIFTSLEKVIDAFGGGIGILTKFSPLLFGLVSPKISEGIAKIGMSFENTKINAEIAKSEVEGFQNQLNQKIGEGAELSGYTKQVQDLINKYGELSKTMSVEQKNQFKESLASLIENEGPKATKQLENYQNKVKEIRSLEIGKDNKILKDVIDAQDEKAIEDYQNKIEDLQKTLSQPINKDSLEQVKKQIQDTLGDSDIAKKLIQDLELSTEEINLSGLSEKIEEAISQPLENIDMSQIEEQAKQIFGEEDTENIKRYKDGMEEIASIRSQMLKNDQLITEEHNKALQLQEEQNKANQESQKLSKEIREQRQKTIEAAQKAAEIEMQALNETGAQSIDQLRTRLEAMEAFGDVHSKEYQDLKDTVEIYDAYKQDLDDAFKKLQDLHGQYDDSLKTFKDLGAARAEALNNEQDYIELQEKYKNRLIEIQEQLKNGALTEEEANRLMAEAAKEASDEMENLKDRLGETAAELRGVKEQSAETSAEIMSLQQSFEEIKKINFAQHFMDIAQAGVALYSAFQSLVELGNIWDDNDLTQGEKIAQTFTILSTVIPIVVSSVSSGVAAFKALTSAETASAIASAIKTAAMGSEAVAAKLAGKAVEELTLAEFAATVGAGTLTLALLPIIGIVAAVGVAIFIAVKAVQAWQKEHRTSVENLKEANEELQKTTDKYNEMKSAISDYKDAKKGLDELKKGTVEYAEAVTDLNTKVLDLVEKYPELKKFMTIGKNGVLEISDEGLEEFQKKQKEELDEASRNAIVAGISTEQDRRDVEARIRKEQGAQSYISKEYYENNPYEAATEAGQKYLEAYETQMEALNKADQSLLTAYTKTFSSFADYNEKEVSVVISQLWDQYNGDVEKIKEAIADTESMIESLNYNNKVNDYVSNRENGVDNILEVVNGDYSSIGNYQEIANLRGLAYDEKTLNAIASTMEGGVTEGNKKEAKDKILKAVKEITNELSELPGPLQTWVTSDIGLDKNIVEKFIGQMDGISEKVQEELGKGISDLGDSIDKDKFTDILSGIDWTQGEDSLNNFKEQIKSLGLKYEELPEEVQKYVEAQLSANSVWNSSISTLESLTTAMGQISKMKFGDMLSEKDYQELVGRFSGLENYFQKVGEKYEYIATNNKKVLDELKKAYREQKEELEGLDTAQIKGSSERMSKMSGKGLEEQSKATNDFILKNLSTKQISALTGYSEDDALKMLSKNAVGLQGEELEEYLAFIKKIEDAQETAKQRDKEFIAAQISSLQELDAAVKDGTVSYAAAEEEREYIRNKELQSLGVSEEAYKNYILEIGEDINKINDTEIMIRFKIDLNGKKAFEDIDKMFADLPKKADRSAADTATAMTELTNIFEKELDIDITDFLDKDNFNLFEQMVGGDEEARQQLISNFQTELSSLAQQTAEAAQRGDTKTANMLQGQQDMLTQALAFLLKFQDKWGEAAEERLNDIKKQSLELQKQQAEFARSQTQRSISKVENKMAHATGDEYVSLYKQREGLRKQEIEDTKTIHKLELDRLDNEQVMYKTKMTEANVDMSKLTMLIEQGKNYEEIVNDMKLQGEALDLVYNYLQSITTENQTRIKQAQEIADLEEEIWITVDKTLDAKRRMNNIDRKISKKEKEGEGLVGKARIDNQEEIEAERQSKKQTAESTKTILENQRKEDYNSLRELIGNDIQIIDDGLGGIANVVEILEKFNGSENIEDIQNFINNINDASDAIADLTDEYEEHYTVIDEMTDEQAQIASNDKKLAKLQQEAQGLTGKALMDNLNEQSKILTENKKLSEKIIDYRNNVLNDYVAELTSQLENTGIEVKVENGQLLNEEEIRKALEAAGVKPSVIDTLINNVKEGAADLQDAKESADSIDKKMYANYGNIYDVRNENLDNIIKQAEAKQKNLNPTDPEYINLQKEIDQAKKDKLENTKNKYTELYEIEGSNLYKYRHKKGKEKYTTKEGIEAAGISSEEWSEMQKAGIKYDPVTGKFYGEAKDISESSAKKIEEYNKARNEAEKAYTDMIAAEQDLNGKQRNELQDQLNQKKAEIENIDDQIVRKEKEISTLSGDDRIKAEKELLNLKNKKNKLVVEELELQKELNETYEKSIEDYTGIKFKDVNYYNEDGSLNSEKIRQDAGYYDMTEDQQAELDNYIKTLEDGTKEANKMSEALKNTKLPVKDYAEYERTMKNINKDEQDLTEKQNKLNLKNQELSDTMSQLKDEASYLYGDDLIANLEAQLDCIDQQTELLKKQVEIDKQQENIAKRKLDAENKRVEKAKEILKEKKEELSSALDSKWTDIDGKTHNGYSNKNGEKIKLDDYIDENGNVMYEKLQEDLIGAGYAIEDITKLLEGYEKAQNEVTNATNDAITAENNYGQAVNKTKQDTVEVTKKEKERLEIKKQEYETKLKLAEEAITRETNAQHKLTKALRDTEKAITDVQRAQDGLTGPALISKLQEEIQLQQKKKQILEQQLLQIQEQIKLLLDLYNVQLSQRFGVNVGFKVDEHGVSNLDEIYAAVDKVDEKLRGEYMQFIQQYSSTLNGLSSSALSAMDSIDSMTDSIEDLNKKIKETEMDNLFKTHEEKWNAEEQQLKQISRELNKISKEQSKLSGNALIANLDAQQKMLDKQIETQKRKLDLMKAELQTMQAMLAMQGVMFSEDGLIANYAQVFAKGDEKVNGYMQAYQQLYDSIMDLEDGIQETYDKKADLEAQKTQERLRMFNAKIDVELNLAKAKREWQNFKREFLNTLNGAAELNDNILEKTKQNMKDIYDITTKDVTLLTDHVNKIISEIHLMQGGGTSSLYGSDQQTALSDLANYRQQIQESLSSLQDKMKQVNDAYLQQLDKIKSKFDDQLSNYELIHQIISHDMNIIKILRGDQAYEELARYYDKAAANYEQQIQFLRKQVDYWKNLMDQAVVGSEKWEKFQQNWKDALSKLYSAVDSAMDNIVSKYDAKINAIFDKLRKGTKLDWKLEKWDLDKQLSDMFLDKVSTEYSLQKLQSSYLKKAAEYEDEPALRQEVLDLMQKQIEKYRALSKEAQRKGRLTEREVELANKQFELEMKRLELQKAEEQMTDKTQMRLRRDSSGDYRYEYVAKQDDEDKQKIEDLRDEILDLEEEIRLYAEETRREVVDTYTSAIQTAEDGIKQAWEDFRAGLISEEEYKEKVAYYQSWLEEMGAAAATQYNFSVKELTSSTYEEIEELGQRAMDDIYKLSQPVYATMEELYPMFGDAFESLDSLIRDISALLTESLSELSGLMSEMEAELYAIGDAAGLNFGMIIDGTDETIDAMYQLIDDNYELLDQYDQELNQIEALIDELERLQDAYRDVYDAAMEAVDAAMELKETAQDIPSYGGVNYNTNINIGGNSGTSAPSNSSSQTSKSSTGKPKNTNTNTKIQDVLTQSQKDLISVGSSVFSTASSQTKKDDSSLFAGMAGVLTSTAANILKQKLFRFYQEDVATGAGTYATGGYTGEWGKEGKVAILHEKELVLNASDTKNMLEMLKISRNNKIDNSNIDLANMVTKMSSLIDMTYEIYQQMYENSSRELDTMTTAINNITKAVTSNTTNNINANFPNATQSSEIEKALQNLSNATSQRLGLNKRR